MLVADTQRQELAELRQCAYRLGVAFAAAAEAESDPDRKLAYGEHVLRCFHGVRVAIALDLRLQRLHAAPEARTGREDLNHRAEREPSESDRQDDRERDDDRDREPERASLPLLLRTLNAVVADAATLTGPEPAALPALREVLARIAPPPQARRPRQGPSLRARLTGSAAPTIQTTSPPAKPGVTLPPRRATGPPRR